MSTDRYELLAPDDPGTFEELYRIYAASFDPREAKPLAALAAMAADADYRFLLVRRGGEVVGGSVLLLPPGEPFGLLEYMVVAAGHRGSGIGAGLFRHGLSLADAAHAAHAADTAGGPGQHRTLLVEVDSDREPGPDQELRRRRKRLYERLGCATVAGLSYLLPLPGAPPMELMVHLPPGRTELSRQELERWLGVLYQRAYGCAADDPRIARMLATVDDPPRLVRLQ